MFGTIRLFDSKEIVQLLIVLNVVYTIIASHHIYYMVNAYGIRERARERDRERESPTIPLPFDVLQIDALFTLEF